MKDKNPDHNYIQQEHVKPGRIAMVAYTHYHTDPRCRREATLAADALWDVHFYALSLDGKAHTTKIDGITLHQLPMQRYRGDSSSSYIVSYLRFLLVAGWEVQKHHMRSRFAIVHVNTMPDFMVGTALLPRIFGAKVIIDIHDVMPEIYMTKFQLPAKHWIIRAIVFMELVSARMAHRVLTAEHPKSELLVKHGIPKDKIQVLLNLPDEKLFIPQFTLTDPSLLDDTANAGYEFRLIYHGTLAHRLGLDNAVAALNILKEDLPGLRLQLIGDGDQLQDLHNQVERAGLTDRVSFTNGFIPIERVIPTIKRAHLAVIPTRHDISTDYMLPTKFLEYLALGIPAVLTPTKTVRYYFGDDHPLYIYDPTPSETAKKIMWVRENYEETKRLTAELQASWISRFSWAEHKQDYLKLLSELGSQ